MSDRRKEDHVRICLDGAVEGPGSNGLERVALEPSPTPADPGDVDLRTQFLGTPLRIPFMIAPMSGGWALGRALNRALAALAARRGVAFAVGSMRPALEDPGRLADYDVKSLAPDVPVLGNLGVWQLRDRRIADRYHATCESLGFDGLMVHVNPAHELAQPEGERDLSGVMDALRDFAARATLPVLVKEVGHGFEADVLAALAELPIQGLDVAGAGGTNWPLVEAARIPADSAAHRNALVLSEAGRDTCETLIDAAPRFADRLLIAGGGIRDATDIAKALALGADVAAVAAPLLRLICRQDSAGALTFDDALADPWFDRVEARLRELFAAAGAISVTQLRDSARQVTHA